MSTFKRLTELFKSSQEVAFSNSSKIVLLSDCHRGDGSWVDDFSHNQNIYYSALKHYFNIGFTYIELGDGDELWKNKNFSDISNIYIAIEIENSNITLVKWDIKTKDDGTLFVTKEIIATSWEISRM